MARAVWTGAISFGLVNVPVKAYTAARDHEVHFHQLERGTGARVRYRKVSERTGEELDADDIELGYELAKGRYVTVDPDELEELRPRATRSIEVRDFVALEDIDPIYYDHTYWLAPADEPAERAYSLLLSAMEDRRRVGIGTVVMRRKQYLAAIRPLDGVLALSTMRFADEIVDREGIDELPDRIAEPDERELTLATSIIDALASDWDPERYHDTYTEELRDLIERKAEGETVTAEEPPESEAEVIDLMAALEASMEAARKARRGSVSSNGKPAKAAKKAARKVTGTSSGRSAAKTVTKRSPKKTAKRTAKKAAKKAAKKQSGRPAGKASAKKASARKAS